MKTKTRRLIGNILVWGGLLVISFTTYNMFSFNNICGGVGDSLAFYTKLNVGAIISILIGGLWGMRK